MNIDVWCWCLGDSDAVFMVSMHNAVLLLIPWVWWSRMNAVYAGESSTNFTRECTLILFSDAMKRNFQKLSMKTVIPIGHSTILTRLVIWLLHTKYKVI